MTSDMVVSAQYETKSFDVTFRDVDGTVIDEQTIEYDGVAETPELPSDEADGVEYYDWDLNLEELYGVKEDIDVFPIYEFDETTPTPTADVKTGSYDSSRVVSLDCEDENAVIYYTIDGSDPKENPDAKEYSEPITVDSRTELKFYASTFGKNASEVETEYYVINNDGVIVTIHDNIFDENADTYLFESMAEFNMELIENEGYTLDGVFYDEECSQSVIINNSNTVKGMVDLYAKYSINTYTVSFEKEDGTVLDMQQVKYTESATAPDVADEGEMKFVGWDIDDWKCVTEDLVVHPVFKDKNEIISVNFDRNKYQMEAGATYQINATITTPVSDEYQDPNDAVVWSSENDEIASVDNTGLVTANKAGSTKIYAITEDKANIAECEITVIPSVNNSIVLSNLSTLDVDSEGYLRRILKDKNTVEEISLQFINASGILTFTNADGVIVSGTDKVGTNTVISLMNGDEVLDSITVVMTGDVDCDGAITVKDVSYAARVIAKKNTADAAQLRAMDVNGDGKVNIRDVSCLLRFLVGKEQISQ